MTDGNPVRVQTGCQLSICSNRYHYSTLRVAYSAPYSSSANKMRGSVSPEGGVQLGGTGAETTGADVMAS
jgi:hypothetical protein